MKFYCLMRMFPNQHMRDGLEDEYQVKDRQEVYEIKEKADYLFDWTQI